MKKTVFVLWALVMAMACKQSKSHDLSGLLLSQGNMQMSESSLSRSANYCDNLFYEPSQSLPVASDQSAPVTSGTGGSTPITAFPSPSSSPVSSSASAGTGGSASTSNNTSGSGTRSRFPRLYPSRTRGSSGSALNLAAENTGDVFVRFTDREFTIYSSTGQVLLTGFWREVNTTAIEMIVQDQSYLVGVYTTQDQEVSLSTPPPALCLTPDAAYNPAIGTDLWNNGTGGPSVEDVGMNSWAPSQTDIYSIDSHYNGTWCYVSGFPYELSLIYDGTFLWTAFFDQNRSVLNGASPYLTYTENTVGLYRSYDSVVRFNNSYIPSYNNSGIASEAVLSFADASQNRLRVVYGLDRAADYIRSSSGECSLMISAEEVARLPHP